MASPAELLAQARGYPRGARVFSRRMTARAPCFASISPQCRERQPSHRELRAHNTADERVMGADITTCLSPCKS